MARRRVMLVGPWKWTTGGVTTFMNNVVGSALGREFDVIRFNIARPPKRNVADNYGYAAVLRGGIARIAVGAAITVFHLVIFPFVVLTKRPDVIQVQSSDFQVFWEASLYVWMARLLRVPVLMRLGGAFDHFYAVSSPRARRAICHVLRWPDRLIVQSEYWRTIVGELGRSTGVVVLSNSVPDRLAEWADRPRDVDPICFFAAGSEAVRKGFTEIMEAMCLLRSEGRSPQLHVAAANQDLSRRIRDSNLGETVRIDGVLSHGRLLDAMRNAQIFLLPSRAEGFPNALVEAMALGLAPIVTPVGAIPEIVAGTGAIVIPQNSPRALADAIASLTANPALCTDAGRTAQEAIRARYVHSAVMPILADAWNGLVRTGNR